MKIRPAAKLFHTGRQMDEQADIKKTGRQMDEQTDMRKKQQSVTQFYKRASNLLVIF
jgi:hypothetical protein